MLQELHVKNFALIDDVEIEFQEGLNILSGETGAGKSIIMGSVNTALGAKTSKEMIRQGCAFAYVELIFSLNENQKKKFSQLDLDFDFSAEDSLVISRKLTDTKSVARINGETVSLSVLNRVAGVLIDIHGQSDNQTLLRPKKQMDLLDSFGKEKIEGLFDEYTALYEEYTSVMDELNSQESDDSARAREIHYLEYVVNEIDSAGLSVEEEESLAGSFKRLSNSRRLQDSIGSIREGLFESGQYGNGFGERISQGIGELTSLSAELPEDAELKQMTDMMYDLESILEDLNRQLDHYCDSLENNQEEFDNVSARLNVYHDMKQKYGKSVEDVLNYRDRSAETLNRLKNYEERRAENQERLEVLRRQLLVKGQEIHEQRCAYASELSEKISSNLGELNFAGSEFEVRVEDTQTISSTGLDKITFLIAPNPGEPLKPMADIVSGGELSRIMLAVKNVLADVDEIETFVFDEIDAGISGRTAQMVALKLQRLSEKHQIICISHLPQIVAMADYHFLIEKKTVDAHTFTQVTALEYEDSVNEIARLLGGSAITQAVLDNAWEMKELAQKSKFGD